MGICQSQHAQHSEGRPRGPLAKEPYHPSMKSTPGGKHAPRSKAGAYEIALLSPSEKTDLTEALSPTSIFSPPNTTTKKRSTFTFVLEDKEDNGYPSDEEPEERHPIENVIVASTPQYNKKEVGDSNDGNDDDELGYTPLGISRFDNNDDDSNGREQTRTVGAYPRMMGHQIYTPIHALDPDGASGNNADGEESVEHNPSRRTTTIQELFRPTIRFLQEQNRIPVEDEHDVDDLDNVRTVHVCKPDPPPLLAPPKDIEVVVSSSNTETSVNPATVSCFNKLKSQVKKANKLEKHRRQLEKIEDRRKDIEGYKELWGEYSVIQEQVREKELNTKIGESISLNDSTTWFVDFSILNSNQANHLEPVGDLESIHEDDQHSEVSLSHLTESTFCSQKKLAQHKEAQRQKSMSSFSVGSRNNLSTIDFHDTDEEPDDNSFAIDLNGSIISDFDNGSNASFAAEIDKVVANDDYGVLSRYSKKSIESSVPTHTDNFYAQQGDEDLGDTETFFCAQTPQKGNVNFAKYLEENCLPSVTIENAETGAVRWRTFPKSDEPAKVNRKIDFSDQTENESESQEHTNDYSRSTLTAIENNNSVHVLETEAFDTFEIR